MNAEDQNDTEKFAVTFGDGKDRPQGRYQRCASDVQAIANLLRERPSSIEAWWSLHLWKNNYREQKGWLASSGIAIDVDFINKPDKPSDDTVAEILSAAISNELPGSIFHLTPHGVRIIWIYSHPCSDRNLQEKAERGAGAVVVEALKKLKLNDRYKVDSGCVADLARLFYAPNCIVGEEPRSAEVIVMRDEPVSPVDLAMHDVPQERTSKPVARKRTAPVSNNLEAARAAWNADNHVDWPRNSGECPICGHNGCFGRLPENETKWHCFSENHPNVGHKCDKGYLGDALDVAAYQRGCTPTEVLRKDGYLLKSINRDEVVISDAPHNGAVNGSVSGSVSDTELIEAVYELKSWVAKSYYTLVEIIQSNAKDILEGRKIELNEMTGNPDLGRKQVTDADAFRIRYKIEKRFVASMNKETGVQTGMRFSVADIHGAIAQVAAAAPYHPVREYLNAQKHDGKQHISKVLGWLGAEDNEFNQIMIRRFFISVVARVLEPGCKVDTVLILVGKQGAKKSSFFQALASPWFIDSTIDLSGDVIRAYMTMRRALILEWAELESLLRARRSSAVKSFLTSRVDSYVPKYGHYEIDVPRSGVIVGTTNSDEFLEDETGERRFWPLKVGNIDLKAVEAERHQLWAEAVAMYRAGERWWLDSAEEPLLGKRHDDHKVLDAWTELVIGYASGRAGGFTTADVLQDAIDKEIGQWNRGDEMRIAKILKGFGYVRRTDPGKTSRKIWKK